MTHGVVVGSENSNIQSVTNRLGWLSDLMDSFEQYQVYILVLKLIIAELDSCLQNGD